MNTCQICGGLIVELGTDVGSYTGRICQCDDVSREQKPETEEI